jgi:hypothetical protein
MKNARTMSISQFLLRLVLTSLVLVSSTQGAARNHQLDVSVIQGRLSQQAKVVRMTKGDQFVLNVTSDAEDELHVHGLDIRARVYPGKVTLVTVRAIRTGRFAIELHHANVTVAVLEVYPQ